MGADLDRALSQLDQLLEEGQQALASAEDRRALDGAKTQFLGKKSRLKALEQTLGRLAAEERPLLGRRLNEVKKRLDGLWKERRRALGGAKTPQAEPLDVTLPGRRPALGALHPITQITEEILEIFSTLGFEVAEGPEVEDDFHNFVALNIPETHIARDPAENLYLRTGALLRSQTSTIQIRVMENRPPPIRIVAFGKVYRPDTFDASHSPMFHQVEGFMVDEKVTMRDLKASLFLFARRLYGENVRLRLRPSYFPFTEPSAEVDFGCPFCDSGCRTCSNKGWIEMGGCGMIDPNVFQAVGYDPEQVTGFAFGLGIDRIAMRRYGMPDIRYLFDNDLRFLKQFSH